jgi:predicted TPR repeat methyltransferase
MAEEYLRRVYDLETQDATDAYYSEWAATYDDEVTRQGYRSPQRCAEALAKFVPADRPVLDVGCGTGISGAALRAAGFADISGQDINAEMLELAKRSGLYRETWVTDLATPFPFKPGTYAALAAIGVIGIGAAPASLLGEALDALAPGGHLVFSYNDHALEQPQFPQALDDALASHAATQVFCERGPHFEALGTHSNVYVLRRP